MKYLESRIAVLISLIFAAAAGYITYDSLSAYEDVRLTATTFATLSATLFGFLMTSLSMLIAISGMGFIKNLRLTGHYQILISQLFKTAGMLLATIMVAMCGHVFPDDLCKELAIALSASLLVASLFSFIAVGCKFHKLITLLIK